MKIEIPDLPDIFDEKAINKATQRAKISLATKGRTHSPQHRAAISAWMTGRKLGPRSAEQRAKLSAATKGKPRPPLSDEAKAAISAGLKNKGCSPETRAKLSAARKGKKYSPETKAKLSVSLKKAIANRSPERAAEVKKILSLSHCKPCTVDGVTIYPSRKALIEALGNGKNGAGHPNFRYI